jgi:hypothetical protein
MIQLILIIGGFSVCTIFKNTNLESVDFRTSFSYSIDPDLNRIEKAKFSLSRITALLDKLDIEIEK